MDATLLWQDYAVFVGFIVITVGIGCYHGFSSRKQTSAKTFFMADRELHLIPTMISLTVSFVSAVMILGFVAEMIKYGWMLYIGFVCSNVVALVLVQQLIVPVLYPLKLTSVYEYLDYRYNSKLVRCFTSFFGVINAIIYMAMAMLAPCKALQYLSGSPLNVTVPLMAFVCILYTSISLVTCIAYARVYMTYAKGGMKAVIWTDVFQFGVMISALSIIAVKGTYDEGKDDNIFTIAYRGGRLTDVSWSLDPRVRQTVWTFLVGNVFYAIAGYGFGQASVQRYCATGSLLSARRVIFASIPCLVCLCSLISYCGLIVFAHNVNSSCDPLAAGNLDSYNMLFPVYVRQAFAAYKGSIGVFMAVLYGGALSTISSSLSGAAANIWEDLIKPYIPRYTEHNQTWITRLLVVNLGLIAAGLVFVLDRSSWTFIQLTTQMMGAIMSPICGLFIMAMLFRRSEYIGAICGMVSGFAAVLFVCWGSLGYGGFTRPLHATSIQGCEVAMTPFVRNITNQPLPQATGFENIFTISYLWYLLLGTVITNIVGLFVSSIVQFRNKENRKIPNELFINFRIFVASVIKDDDRELETLAVQNSRL